MSNVSGIRVKGVTDRRGGLCKDGASHFSLTRPLSSLYSFYHNPQQRQKQVSAAPSRLRL